MSKDKLIPEMRFPEFESDGHFQEKTLGYFCNYWNGSGNESGVTEDGQYFLISLNSIDIEGNLKNDMKRVSATDNSLKKGDLVMVLSDVAHGNFLGLTAIIPDDNYVLNQRMAGLGIKDFLKIDPRYLRLFINYNQKYFKKQGQGSSQQNLSKASVIDFPVLVPLQLTEQQKIASCLSSLDELLTAHNEKLDALKDHKKGLMQNLFPQEGETVPKVRFPEFEGDGDWVEKSFENLFEIGNGRDYKHLEEGNIPVYGSGGFMLSVNDYLYDGESACIGRKGTINNPMFLSGKFWTVDTLFYTHSFKDCLPKFIYYIFQNINWLRHNEAGGVPSLSKTNIYKIETVVPKPIEQKKIVHFLSGLDELITAQADKIEQLQQHKKGLMQGLFPKIES